MLECEMAPYFAGDLGYQAVRAIPGVGPILAAICAEIGDLSVSGQVGTEQVVRGFGVVGPFRPCVSQLAVGPCRIDAEVRGRTALSRSN